MLVANRSIDSDNKPFVVHTKRQSRPTASNTRARPSTTCSRRPEAFSDQQRHELISDGVDCSKSNKTGHLCHWTTIPGNTLVQVQYAVYKYSTQREYAATVRESHLGSQSTERWQVTTWPTPDRELVSAEIRDPERPQRGWASVSYLSIMLDAEGFHFFVYNYACAKWLIYQHVRLKSA